MCCDNGIINENNATEIFNEVDLMIRRPLKGFFDLHQLKDFISKKPIVNECPYNPIYRFK